MNIFYSDMEPLSQYSPVTLQLSPATRILYENPGNVSHYQQQQYYSGLHSPGQSYLTY